MRHSYSFPLQKSIRLSGSSALCDVKSILAASCHVNSAYMKRSQQGNRCDRALQIRRRLLYRDPEIAHKETDHCLFCLYSC